MHLRPQHGDICESIDISGLGAAALFEDDDDDQIQAVMLSLFIQSEIL